MAFQSAAGYSNLPNGVFTPVMYSKKAQIAFREASVIQAITNTDYMGEISDSGDTVKIIKEPNISVSSYSRGQKVTPQDLDDEEITLTVDQANSFSFKVDDIEQKHAHHDWTSMAADRAGFALKDAMDAEVLSYMIGQVNTSAPDHLIGTSAAPQDVQLTKTAGDFTPLELMNRMRRLLDEQNVPSSDRWFVADPYFYELLGDEDSKVLSDDYTAKGVLDNGLGDAQNGLVSTKKLRGFTLYMSNNLPTAGDGPSAATNSDYGVILAGHKSSCSTAEQIIKQETMRDPDSFADVVRGLHVYGRKVLRKEALIGAYYHSV